MFSPEVEKALLTGEWTEETFAEWDADDDPIIAEVRRARQEIRQKVMTEFGHDWERYTKHLLVVGYACGRKYVSSDWDGQREAEAELAKLPPGVEELPQSVKDALYARALAAKRDLANRS
jgi:hypothetical protein